MENANWQQLKDNASVFCQEYLKTSDSRDVADNHNSLLGFFNSCLNLIPSGMSKSRVDLPWLSPELKRSCRRNQRLYNQAKKSGKPESKKRYQDARKSFQAALKKAHAYQRHPVYKSRRGK